MNDKIKKLYELGEAQWGGDWPDYLQFGFNDGDVPALIALVTDESLNQADGNSKAVWAPLHAWRTLGQIGSGDAVDPLIAHFSAFYEDDWALNEIPKVLGMIGTPAIAPLAAYLNTARHDEFARVMAADSLSEVALRRNECRNEVIRCYQAYLASPDESAHHLNGLLMGCLIDLDAKEVIEDIRRLFAKECVDITCVGDLEEVEIELGLRSERSTPKPNYAKLYGVDTPSEDRPPHADEILNILDSYLMRYGHDDAILDVSELDGFFAALACAPNTILPSHWLPAIWGGESRSPAWENQHEFTEFTHAAMALYNQVTYCLNENTFQALFLEHVVEEKTYTIVDEWCEGFMRGVSLWEPLFGPDAALAAECLQPIRLFCLDDTPTEVLDAMGEEEIAERQQMIEPAVQRLHQYFLAQRASAAAPYVRGKPKTGRNDPCPCGSGKKFKKCCLH